MQNKLCRAALVRNSYFLMLKLFSRKNYCSVAFFFPLGFGAFCFISAFIMLIAAAIYISPLFFGSTNEVKMIRAPQEIDTGRITAVIR